MNFLFDTNLCISGKLVTSNLGKCITIHHTQKKFKYERTQAMMLSELSGDIRVRLEKKLLGIIFIVDSWRSDINNLSSYCNYIYSFDTKWRHIKTVFFIQLVLRMNLIWSNFDILNMLCVTLSWFMIMFKNYHYLSIIFMINTRMNYMNVSF